MSDPRDSNSPFGVLEFLPWDHAWNGHHYSGERLSQGVALMKEAGICFVRMDFLWNDVQPARESFSFKKYERIVDVLSENGLKILGVLNYSPSWIAQHWNEAPDRTLYTQYAVAVVRHFKEKVKYWEIWNEPDHPTYWQPQDDMAAYTLLLKNVYPALKKEDPTAVVLLGGLSQAVPASLRHVYQKGGRDYFDVVNIHPFINPLMPDALGGLRYLYQAVRRIMEEHSDANKPIWWTEVGCPGVRKSVPISEWWLGKNPTEAHQADWVRNLYGEPLGWLGVAKIFWAFFRDTPNHFGNGIDYLGLVREDFSKKPAYEAYQRVALGTI